MKTKEQILTRTLGSVIAFGEFFYSFLKYRFRMCGH